MSGNHKNTSDYEKDFLLNEMKLIQIKNSTIFIKNDIFCLSPSVKLNKSNYYWFDLREININKFDKLKYSKFLILIKVVDKGFILLNFEELEKIMQSHTKEEKNLLKVWGFKIEIKDKSVKIINKKDYSILLSSLISREDIKIEFT
jgi:hypothetical protein